MPWPFWGDRKLPKYTPATNCPKRLEARATRIISEMMQKGLNPSLMNDIQLGSWKDCGAHSVRYIRAIFPYKVDK